MIKTHFINIWGFDSLKQEFHLTFQEDQIIVLSYANPIMYVDQLFGIGRDQDGFYSIDVDFNECVVKRVNTQHLSLEEILNDYKSLKHDEWFDYKHKAIRYFVEKYLPQANLFRL